MKRNLFLILTLLSIIALLAACSSSSGTGSAPASSSTPSGSGESTAGQSSPPETKQPVKIKVGYPALSGAMMQLWVMKEAKLDEKYGLDMELIYLQATPAVLQAMDSGEIDFAHAGTGVISANLAGQDVIFIANPQPRYVFYLYGRPGINSLEDLKGKVFAGGVPGAAFDTVPRYAFAQAGIDPDKELKEYVRLTNPSLIMAALESGDADGGVLSPPHSFTAEELGFNRLVDMTVEGPNTISVGLAAKSQTLKERREVALNFMRGYVEAYEVMQNDPDLAIQALANYSGITDPEELEKTYETYKDTFPSMPIISEEQMLEAAKTLPDFPEGTDLSRFYDNSLLEEIQQEK